MSGDHLFRIAEVGLAPPDPGGRNSWKRVLDDLGERHAELCQRAGLQVPLPRLDLVVFGTVDIVSIQEVADLKHLAVAATYEPTRFQRSSGAWANCQLPSWGADRPYVRLSYLKFNPLADLLAGHVLRRALMQEVPRERRDVWLLLGLDTPQVIVAHAEADLYEFRDFAWKLRDYTLRSLRIEVPDERSDSAGVSREEARDVRVFSWSHSIVGMPFDVVRYPERHVAFKTDRPQRIILRTRYRRLPGCTTPVGTDAASVLGNFDLVSELGPAPVGEDNAPQRPGLPEHGTVSNDQIRSTLGRMWSLDGYVVETEVQLGTRERSHEHLAADQATVRFCARMRAARVDIEQFTRAVRPRDWRSHRKKRPWSRQRTNGGVNLLLALNQRFADPFDLGHVWRLYAPLRLWLTHVSKSSSPQDTGLVRWAKHLERAIRLEDDQEDPSYRPSLPLSFASRGGYVALREAFVAYVEEAAAARGDMSCPLVVDSVETKLSAKPALGTFILLVSGTQIQTFKLWPFVLHEIEHIRLLSLGLSDKSPSAEGPLLEAICDVAMVDSGALGFGSHAELRGRALRVILWSVIEDFFEQVVANEPAGGQVDDPDVVAAFGLRIACLSQLITEQRITGEGLRDEIEQSWWRESMNELLVILRLEGTEARLYARVDSLIERKMSEDAAELFAAARAQSRSAGRPPGSCVRTVAERCLTLPPLSRHTVHGKLGVPITPADTSDLLVALRTPVWNARRRQILLWLQDRTFRATNHPAGSTGPE